MSRRLVSYVIEESDECKLNGEKGEKEDVCVEFRAEYTLSGDL